MEATDRISLRLDRANEHLHALEDEVGAFLRSDPYGVMIKKNQDTGECIASAIVRRQPPLRLSVIIGDCIHNLRSSLDHLAWQLTVPVSDTQARYVRFPISRVDSGDLERMLKQYFRPRFHAALREFQPYQRRNDPKGHELWILNGLWNIDKHQSFHLAAAYSSTDITFSSVAGRIENPRIYDRRMQQGVIIGECLVVPSHADVKLDGAQSLYIVFDEAGPARGGGVLATLRDIYEYIRGKVMDRFEHLLR